MKRTVLFLLLFCLILPLCGCTGDDTDNITFYYLRTQESISYGARDAVIAPVVREVSEQNSGLNYLLRMYLSSPLPENYRSPFPSGTYLINAVREENTLVVELSEDFSTLEDIHLSLAAACLCATCFDLSNAETLRIISADLSLEFHRSSFLLLDDVTPTE